MVILLKSWNKTISAFTGRISRQKSTDNTNAAGKMLLLEGTNDSVIVHMHNLPDPNISAAKEWVMNLTDRAGLDNKVVSFTYLVGGNKCP